MTDEEDDAKPGRGGVLGGEGVRDEKRMPPLPLPVEMPPGPEAKPAMYSVAVAKALA
jgi:hypothetical protein